MIVCSGILMYGKSACGRLWKYAYLHCDLSSGGEGRGVEQIVVTYRQRRMAYPLRQSAEQRASTGLAHLVANDEDVLLPFQFHDDRFETDHYVPIRLAAWTVNFE